MCHFEIRTSAALQQILAVIFVFMNNVSESFEKKEKKLTSRGKVPNEEWNPRVVQDDPTLQDLRIEVDSIPLLRLQQEDPQTSRKRLSRTRVRDSSNRTRTCEYQDSAYMQ